jgi:methyl-accepting chemotaxis protein
MATASNSRKRPELRRSPRRQFNYNAAVLTEDKKPLLCSIADISESGARIVMESDGELPERFILLLSRSGGARRFCRLVWRDGRTVGVEFPLPHG